MILVLALKYLYLLENCIAMEMGGGEVKFFLAYSMLKISTPWISISA